MKPISRRSFLGRSGTGIAAATTLSSLELALPQTQKQSEGETPPGPSTDITLRVNGRDYPLRVEDRWTLVEVLRDHLGLTGSRVGCDRGECGACTVLLDGQSLYSCSYLAVWADGKEITTVEGLARGDQLDPLQESFIRRDGPQCGFCTSGQLIAAKALLDQNPHPTAEEVRQALSGNICRCSNYNHYLAAVMSVAGKEESNG